MRTGLTAWKLAKGLYVIPLLMAYTPLIGGDFETMIRLTVFGVFGLYAFVAVMEGYLEDKLTWSTRGLMLIAAIAMLWPNLHISIQFSGLALFLGVFIMGYKQFKLANI